MTRRCLECHADAAAVMKTSHWLWLGEEVRISGREGKTCIGKRNLLNNFCIASRGNEKSCTKCHIGYGWADASGGAGSREGTSWPAHTFAKKVKLQSKAAVTGGCG